MTIQLTESALVQIWPKAPQAVIDAFVKKQDVLDHAGVNHTRQRLAFALANLGHETGGFTIPRLTESGNYTAERIPQVWPSRFPTVESARPYAHNAQKLFDNVYGGRMGNRPGTHDGSDFCGRGGPQITGRDGYEAVGKKCGLDLVGQPELACSAEYQPEIAAGYIDWKRLNAKADVGDFPGYVKIWNGGHIGEADREARLRGIDPVVARLAVVAAVDPVAHALPGAPPTPEPPKAVIDEATAKERAARAGGVGAVATGGSSKAVSTTSDSSKAVKTTTEQPAPKPAPNIVWPVVEWTLIGAGIAVLLVAALALARKKALIKANWI